MSDVQPAADSSESLSKFVFSVEQANITAKDLDLRISALEARIDRLVGKAKINDVPVAEIILSMTSNRSEIELLGKVLLRVCEPVEELAKLKKRKSIVELAKSDINWMLAAFGDFSDQIDELEPQSFSE